jgi:uncharacterized protein
VSQRWFGLASGALFALGLALSGMTDPGKVLAFLDVGGAWDPSLAFVMGGAVGFHGLWLWLTRRRQGRAPASAGASVASAGKGIDARLVVGAAIFGVGWGMSGYCPGPALVTLAYGRLEALLFVPAMVSGMVLFRLLDRRREPNVARLER